MRLLTFTIIVVIALCAVMIPEHRPPNAGLPVVNADYSGSAAYNGPVWRSFTTCVIHNAQPIPDDNKA